MTKTLSAITVTELNEYVKTLIDSSKFLSRVCVTGEISNFTNHYKTGHYYFTLKDDKSLIKAVMFQSYASKMRFIPENNMKVMVTGRISVFPRDGVYQLYAENMEPMGAGELYAAFEQLKQKLSTLGYFDESHKKKLPAFPGRIGIVTSPVGAAVADMKNIISRRFPVAEICIYPALVQGEGAAEDICKGIKHFDNDKDCDVIIIGRGGGSIEDLWAFNSPVLAETIYNAQTPIISAVGHETDFTISDFVADLRAPTPSAAAELAVPDAVEVMNHLASSKRHLDNIFSNLLDRKKSALELLLQKSCFKSPKYMTERLTEELFSADRRISQSMQYILNFNKQSISSVSARLSALNPMTVLARGYSAVFSADGKVIDSAEKASAGDKIHLRFADGTVNATVTDKK